MRIKILSSALEDLYEARLFYERQGVGVGDYFFDSLFSDIDSLVLYGGIHRKVAGYHRLLSKRFPYVHSEPASIRAWVYGLAFFMIIRLPCSIHAVRSVTYLTGVLIMKKLKKPLASFATLRFNNSLQLNRPLRSRRKVRQERHCDRRVAALTIGLYPKNTTLASFAP